MKITSWTRKIRTMIYKLAKEMKLNRLERERLDEQRQRLRSKLEKVTSSLKAAVVSSSRTSTFDYTLNKLTDIEDRIIELDMEYEELKSEAYKMEQILKEYNDIHQRIYFDARVRNISTVALGIKYGYSQRSIQLIISKIERGLKV